MTSEMSDICELPPFGHAVEGLEPDSLNLGGKAAAVHRPKYRFDHWALDTSVIYAHRALRYATQPSPLIIRYAGPGVESSAFTRSLVAARGNQVPLAGRPDYSDRDDALFGITVGRGRLRSTPNPCGTRRRPLPTQGAK